MGQVRMKAAVLVLGLFLGMSVQAETLALQFRGARLGEVIEGIVKGVLARDYVIAGDVPSLQSPVTLNVKAVEKGRVLEVLRSVSASYGVGIVDRDGVLYVERATVEAVGPVQAPDKPAAVFGNGSMIGQWPGPQVDRSNYEPRAYFPKYRSVEFLSMAVQAAGGMVAQSRGMDRGIGGVAASSAPQSTVKQDAVVFSAPPELAKKIDALLLQLDIPMVAVQLKAAVLEVSDNSEQVRSLSGVLSLLGGRVGLTLGAGIKPVGNAIAFHGNLEAILSAVDGDSRFRYLSEPSLRVLDGETARLVVGQDVPVRGAVTVDKNGNSLQSIEYKTAGLVLEVAPKVLEGAVRLKVNQQISSFTTTTTSGIDSPTLLKREASTTVQADDGELIALAGLDENRESGTNSGLSFLPAWMNSKTSTRNRSQVLILLEVKKVPLTAI